MQAQIIIIATLLILGINCDCGCLKCSKNLHVISPPWHPCKVIVRGEQPVETFQYPVRSYPTSINNPEIDGQLSEIINACPPVYAYRYKVQEPEIPVKVQKTLTGLIARPDRVVINRQNCPHYVETGACDGHCNRIIKDYIKLPVNYVVPRPTSILEPISEVYDGLNCCHRYGKSRKKRALPILRKAIRFLLNLNRKPSETLLQKLIRLNRPKRSLLDTTELKLPFLRVTDVENDLQAEDESDEVVGESFFPQNPISYFLQAPIRFLQSFHKLGEHVSPVLKTVPRVLTSSRKYIHNMHNNFKNDVMNLAGHLIGFDKRLVRPRFKRSTTFEPEYSLAFNRSKRYILKVVDEKEVEDFLREKLGTMEPSPIVKKEMKSTGQRRLKVEQLSSKILIDKNGQSFFEIDGTKRPLNFGKKEDNVAAKISTIIDEIKDGNPIVGAPQAVPHQMLKDRINQILSEIQNLIDFDLQKYSNIHTHLSKLQNYKELVVKTWKQNLMGDNNISGKIHILEDFKQLQMLKDKTVVSIVQVLAQNNFMTKKLVKVLVRLQKLQCVISSVVEDFGDKIKSGTEFDVESEIKYVDFLTQLNFLSHKSVQDLENDLKVERDKVLENEMRILDFLRKLLEKTDDLKVFEQAQILWEMKNINKLQKDTISVMKQKIQHNQKVRKELKILFDLLKQLENCDEKQEKLMNLNQKNPEEEEEKVESVRLSLKDRTKILREKLLKKNRKNKISFKKSSKVSDGF